MKWSRTCTLASTHAENKVDYMWVRGGHISLSHTNESWHTYRPAPLPPPTPKTKLIILCVRGTLQHTATHCNTLQHIWSGHKPTPLPPPVARTKLTICVCEGRSFGAARPMSFSELCMISLCVLQCIAVCCSVVQYVAVCCSILQCVAVCCGICMMSLCCAWLVCVCDMTHPFLSNDAFICVT